MDGSDCIFCDKEFGKSRALNDMYCKREECKFYKSEQDYYRDGSRKDGGRACGNLCD